MRRFVFTIVGIVVLYGSILAQGINFSHDLDESIIKAKKENKLVFVDFYTSWCGPCKRLAKEVFTQEEIGDYFNSRFINCNIQCDDKALGEALMKKYQIVAFPTLMFIDRGGNIIHSMAGAPSGDGLIKFAEEAFDPKKNLVLIVKKYNGGDRSEKVVKEYFERMIKASRIVSAREDFEIYFNTLSDKVKCTKFVYDLSVSLKVAPFTPVFEYIEKNVEKYKAVKSEKEVDKFIRRGYLRHLSGFTRKGKNVFEAELARFKAKDYAYYDEFKDYFYVVEAVSTKGIDRAKEYAKRADEFLQKYGQNDDMYAVGFTAMYCNLFWGKDKGLIGIKWMENLLKIKRSPEYLKFYMKVLIRNMRFDEAKKVALEMRDICGKEEMSTESVDKEIKNIDRLKIKYKQ